VKLSTLAMAAFLLVTLGATATAQVSGTDHDFVNNAPGGITESQICRPCHAPHNPAAGTAGVLWNHELSTQTFFMFGSTVAGNAGVTTAGSATDTAPGPTSLKCLSCHDGITAVDNYGGTTTGSVTISGGANVGVDLRNDHPIGVQYPATGTTGYNDKSGNAVGILPLRTNSSGTWTDGVECATCHNPHRVAGVDKFLRVTEAASAICITCHTN